mmetsp:Transcript_22904/g.60306  ORF Transcript_22904/g.60306 Transcript_22904/m.60306 type:complete len:90 (+) Transcript_22904:145-414(+)
MACGEKLELAQPFKGLYINVSQTGVLCETLQALSATVGSASCDNFSTQDHTAVRRPSACRDRAMVHVSHGSRHFLTAVINAGSQSFRKS